MYFGGYKRILFDSVVASILTPIFILFAAHGFIASVVTFTGIALCLYYASCVVKKLNRTVPFFFIWFITSIIYIFISFEFFVSSLLMMDSSENFLFLSLISLALYCLIYTKCLSSQICQPPAPSKSDSLLTIDDKDVETGSRKRSNLMTELCPLFGMLPFCKASRCFICKVSTFSKQLYCQWLDCHISSKNFDFYIMGLGFLVCGLFFYTYLIWTSACHCHLLGSVFGIDIYFPDDCNDVYYDLLKWKMIYKTHKSDYSSAPFAFCYSFHQSLNVSTITLCVICHICVFCQSTAAYNSTPAQLPRCPKCHTPALHVISNSAMDRFPEAITPFIFDDSLPPFIVSGYVTPQQTPPAQVITPSPAEPNQPSPANSTLRAREFDPKTDTPGSGICP